MTPRTIALPLALSLCLSLGCPKKLGGGGGDGGVGSGADGGIVQSAGPSVLQHHRNASRDGLYVDGALTRAAVSTMHVDTGFSGQTSGATFAQPLFMENGPQGKDTVFVATEQNDVFALDAATGAQLWKHSVGTPAPESEFCGGAMDPLGVTGTPIIDPQARALYVAAMINGGSNGTTPRQMIFSLSVDTGTVAWSVDVSAKLPDFDSTVHNQRGALALLNGTLYVPYGGLDGDCANYQGRVVAVSTSNPASVTQWKAAAYSGSAIWGPSGVASDGTNLFVATGNTNDRSGEGHPFPTTWTDAHSEAVLRLTPSVQFSGDASSYFTMSGPGGQDWYQNDVGDADLGSSGVVLVDAPGASPSHLAFAAGKTQSTYLLNRDNLGGKGLGLGANLATNNQVFGSFFAYNVPGHTYLGGSFLLASSSCSVAGADFTVLEVSHASPPSVSFAWCAKQGGKGGAIVSTTDGGNESIVWSYGAAGDETLRAYNGESGALLFTSKKLPGSSQWISPILAKGRVYVAGNGSVTALKL